MRSISLASIRFHVLNTSSILAESGSSGRSATISLNACASNDPRMYCMISILRPSSKSTPCASIPMILSATFFSAGTKPSSHSATAGSSLIGFSALLFLSAKICFDTYTSLSFPHSCSASPFSLSHITACRFVDTRSSSSSKKSAVISPVMCEYVYLSPCLMPKVVLFCTIFPRAMTVSPTSSASSADFMAYMVPDTVQPRSCATRSASMRQVRSTSSLRNLSPGATSVPLTETTKPPLITEKCLAKSRLMPPALIGVLLFSPVRVIRVPLPLFVSMSLSTTRGS